MCRYNGKIKLKLPVSMIQRLLHHAHLKDHHIDEYEWFEPASYVRLLILPTYSPLGGKGIDSARRVYSFCATWLADLVAKLFIFMGNVNIALHNWPVVSCMRNFMHRVRRKQNISTYVSMICVRKNFVEQSRTSSDVQLNAKNAPEAQRLDISPCISTIHVTVPSAMMDFHHWYRNKKKQKKRGSTAWKFCLPRLNACYHKMRT